MLKKLISKFIIKIIVDDILRHGKIWRALRDNIYMKFDKMKGIK